VGAGLKGKASEAVRKPGAGGLRVRSSPQKAIEKDDRPIGTAGRTERSAEAVHKGPTEFAKTASICEGEGERWKDGALEVNLEEAATERPASLAAARIELSRDRRIKRFSIRPSENEVRQNWGFAKASDGQAAPV